MTNPTYIEVSSWDETEADAWAILHAAGVVVIGYAETPVQPEHDHRDPAEDECVSCRVKLDAGQSGNVAACDWHDQTCASCDAEIDHPHGRSFP